ncbi:MAG: hypothetical protein A3E87_00565 [Gammaproteobacteria bacterium RIFCSPHIGHO2_12_FULL_35_23]|nr:MAG: hypothetical protein A3E87_00565 [Gammaproteobacteria bacterium RIFCSPHIGHO2_12_FULL_35_23]
MVLSISAIILFILLEIFLLGLHKKQYSFNFRVIVSLLLGISFGLGLQFLAGGVNALAVNDVLPFMQFFGLGYIALLKMLVIPLVLTSIIASILKLGSLSGKLLNRLAILTVILLLGLTALASGIGLALGDWLNIGQGLSLPSGVFQPDQSYQGLVATLLGMLPSNPILVMTQENTIALVIFAIFIGLATMLLAKTDSKQAKPFKDFILASFHISKKLANIVISLTPFGVLGLMGLETASQGFQSLISVLNFIGAMYLAMLAVLILHCVILLSIKINPFTYFKKAYQPLLVAFTTRSSFGTLPVTEETLKNKFNLPQITASFVPSIGATIGMNACAGIFPAMLVAMGMHILHLPITTTTFFMVMFINAIASLGVSGIPGTAYVAAAVTLTTLGLPYSIVGIVQGIDPIIDMGRTAVNVNGVMTSALVVDKNLSRYHFNYADDKQSAIEIDGSAEETV